MREGELVIQNRMRKGDIRAVQTESIAGEHIDLESLLKQQVASHAVCIRISPLRFVLLVNVNEDEQPRSASKPSHNVLHYDIDIGAAICDIPPTCLRNLAWRDAALKAVMAPPIQPEPQTEPAVVSPCKLHRQLRLAYCAEATQDVSSGAGAALDPAGARVRAPRSDEVSARLRG